MTMDAALDDLLIQWHGWCQASSTSRGFASRSLVVGQYHTSRQYDYENGALDAQLDERTMRTIDAEVCELQRVHQYAIRACARSLVVGAAVVSHPLLPEDPEQRLVVIADARSALAARLVSCGVLAREERGERIMKC